MAAGGKAVAIQGDMAKEADVAQVFETVDKSLGRLTHLVYNCAIADRMSRVEAMARWCKERGIVTKGHPLIWHEVWPRWAPSEAPSAAAPAGERRSARESVLPPVSCADMMPIALTAKPSSRRSPNTTSSSARTTAHSPPACRDAAMP